jgi:hypothetical protein
MAETEGYVDQSVVGLEEPQPMYKLLRETTPVFRAPQGPVVLSRLADIEMALKRTEVFSSNMDAVDLGNVRPLIPLQIDPPQHAKYRRILDPLFTPREIAGREPAVTALVNEMIDSFADRGECDFHAEFAVPLPCTVFLQLLGLPPEDLDKFLAWKDGVIRPEGVVGPAEHAKAAAPAAKGIYKYFERAIDDHIANPRDDVLSALIAAKVEGEPLSPEELLDICFLLIIAGLDTVTDSLDFFFVYLARHRSNAGCSSSSPTSCRARSKRCCGGRRRCPASRGWRCRTSRWADARSARATGSAPCWERPTPTRRSSTIRRSWNSPATPTGTARSAVARTAASAPTSPAWNFVWRCANSTAAYRITRSRPASS